MFLDKTDLSKIVDRHGTEWYHVLSHSPKFLAAAVVDQGPVLTKKRLKTVKTSLDRQERVIQPCQNIRIWHHSLLQPIFSMFWHRFSSAFRLFTIVQGFCQNTLEGLSNLVWGCVKSFQGYFWTFPIKICSLMANLVAHWSNTTKTFLSATIFVVVSGKDTIATSFPASSRIALLCRTWTAHGRQERGMGLVLRRRQNVRSFSKH